MKSIEFNQHQIEAYKNGATMFIVPIDFSDRVKMSEQIGMDMLYPDYIEKYKEVHAPLQKGDEFFIQEDVYTFLEFGGGEDITPASEMKAHQARFKDVVLSAKVIQLHNIPVQQKGECMMSTEDASEYHYEDSYGLGIEFMEWCNAQNIKYEDNPYVFLYTIKGVNNV